MLKRFTPVWNAKLHVSSSILFYKQLSKKINHKLIKEISIFRIFKSIAEQNNWMVASDKKELEEFLEPKIISNDYVHINAPFGFGKVNSTGKIDTIALIEKYKKYLHLENKYQNNTFDYSLLTFQNQQVIYNNVISKKIVFCEGSSVNKNPFFPKVAQHSKAAILIPNKGEYLTLNLWIL